MQVHVHFTAPDIEALVRDLIGSDAEQLLAIDVRTGLDDGDENVDDDVHCRLTAWLRAGGQLGANHAAPTLVRALHGAVRELRFGLERLDAAMLS